jgi:hypothetical protein
MTTFSTSLKLELPGDGQQTGTWGQTTNKNIGTLLEQAITGVQTITMLDANRTLTNLNGTPDEARNAVLVVTGTNSATRQIVAPLVEKIYIVKNNTTGGFSITIGGATGSVVTVPNGSTQIVYCDGVNFYDVINPGFITGNLNISGALTVVGALTGSTGTFSGAVAGSVFNGAGTGLTGTAPALSIGGNAATASLATLATNATNANAATQLTAGPAGIWTVQEASGYIVFRYNGVNKMRLDGSGNLVCAGNITAFGSI